MIVVVKAEKWASTAALLPALTPKGLDDENAT
jgi:hypothetical protein